MKIVTIGGGSSYTPELVEGFIKQVTTLPVRELWLVDIPEGREKLEIIGAMAKRMVAKAGAPIDVRLTLDRREALREADFVTTQIRVGQLDARILDEHIPLKHGLLGQETNGAGGMFKALRTIPVILDIARDMQELCPKAWLINFSNPAGMVTEALLRYGAHKRAIGLCNVPIHLHKIIAGMLQADEKRLFVQFGGLNHMVYALKAYLDGEDVMPKVLDLSTDPVKGLAMTMKNIMPVHYEREFIKSLGVLPCPYHSYYYRRDEQLAKEREELQEGSVRAQKVREIERGLFELYKDENLCEKPASLEQRGGAYYSDAACSLIDSIHNDRRDIQTVNVRNNGAILDIDKDSAVEVSSVITKSGPIPLTVGELPIQIGGLVRQMKSFERLCVEAAIEGDVNKAALALSINPLTPSDGTARAVVLEMLEAHRKYLPNFFFPKK